MWIVHIHAYTQFCNFKARMLIVDRPSSSDKYYFIKSKFVWVFAHHFNTLRRSYICFHTKICLYCKFLSQQWLRFTMWNWKPNQTKEITNLAQKKEKWDCVLRKVLYSNRLYIDDTNPNPMPINSSTSIQKISILLISLPLTMRLRI